MKIYIGDYIRSKYVKKHLPQSKGNGELLDAGCGEGLYKEVVEGKGYKWYGIDIKDNGLDNMRLGDITDMRYDDEQFEAVISVDTLEHVKDDLKAVQEMRRVLKKNGVLIIHVPNKLQEHVLFKPSKHPDHVREGYEFEEIINLMQKAGFKHTEIHPTFNILECLAWEISRLNLKHQEVHGAVIKVLETFNPEDYKNLGWVVIVVKK